VRLPNTRMQRTRSSPSALRSPLMRCPLGVRKRFLGFCASVLLCALPLNAETPWERYLACPNPAAAARVTQIAYSPGVNAEKRMSDDLDILEVQVISRDVESMRLALRLLGKAEGGHVEETLDIMLGRLIRIDPRLFLVELKRAGVKNWGGAVGNFGGPYVDRMDAYACEKRFRIEALRTVNDSDLRTLRDACIRELRQEP
jgi:hypothetical protein